MSQDSMYYGLNVCVPQNFYVEILTHTVIVLKPGVFVRRLGHEGRALINGTSAIIKEVPGRSPGPSTM